jgi:hypothetical protein
MEDGEVLIELVRESKRVICFDKAGNDKEHSYKNAAGDSEEFAHAEKVIRYMLLIIRKRMYL